MNQKEKIKLLKEKLDLIVLPKQLDLLQKGKKYSIEQIYNRLQNLRALEPWETLEQFKTTCKQYEEMHLGFKVIDNDYLIVTDKKKYNPKTKSYE